MAKPWDDGWMGVETIVNEGDGCRDTVRGGACEQR